MIVGKRVFGRVLFGVGVLATTCSGGQEVMFKPATSTLIAKLVTPSCIIGKKCWSRVGSDGEGKVTVRGTELRTRLQIKRKNFFLSLDINMDGAILPTSSKENQQLNRQNTAKFVMQLDGKDYPIFINNFRRSSSILSNMRCTFQLQSAWGKVGRLGNENITIIDSNMDRKFTQDGADAIVVGRTVYGVPLMKRVLVGGVVYELVVKEDGSKITFTKFKGATAQARPKVASKLCKAMVIRGDEGAYDLVTIGKKRIPAGTY